MYLSFTISRKCVWVRAKGIHKIYIVASDDRVESLWREGFGWGHISWGCLCEHHTHMCGPVLCLRLYIHRYFPPEMRMKVEAGGLSPSCKVHECICADICILHRNRGTQDASVDRPPNGDAKLVFSLWWYNNPHHRKPRQPNKLHECASFMFGHYSC